MSYGLYSTGIHEYVLREIEIGPRAARCEEDEACGYGPLFDQLYESYVAAEKAAGRLLGPTDPCLHKPCTDLWCHTHEDQERCQD